MSSPHEQKIVYSFNKFFADFIMFLKRSDVRVKEALRAHYRTIDDLSTSTTHLDWFRDNVDAPKMAGVHEAMADEGAQLAKGVTVAMLARCTGDEEADHALLAQALSFVNLLAAIHHIYREHQQLQGRPEEQDKVGDLLQRTLRVVHGIQQDADVGDEMASILDDDLLTYIDCMADLEALARGRDPEDDAPSDGAADEGDAAPAADDKGDEGDDAAPDAADKGDDGAPPDIFGDMFARFKDTKLGELAQEITEEIDVDQLDLKNPMDLLNIANLTDEKSALGSIVSKMTGKMKSKMESGSLRYEDLMGEAMGLFKGMDLSSMQNNPMFSAMMAGMGQQMGQQGRQGASRGGPPPPPKPPGGGVGSLSKTGVSARERMRRKLEARAAGQGGN